MSSELRSNTSSPGKDRTMDFFRSLERLKHHAPRPSMSYILWVGGLVGGWMGLVYGLVSQSITRMYLPDVPLIYRPFGWVGNWLAVAIGCALVGLICAWPRSASTGIARGVVAFVFVIIFILEMYSRSIQGESIFVLAQSFLCYWMVIGLAITAVFSLPIICLLRVAIDEQCEESDQPFWAWRRARLLLLITLLTGYVGTFSLLPAHVRLALEEVNQVIQQGVHASSEAELPRLLSASGGVEGFWTHARQTYTVEKNDDARYRSALKATAEPNTLVIVARFDDGWVMACLVQEEGPVIRCKGLDE